MNPRSCPHCRQIHAEGAVFCPHTGKAIEADQAPPVLYQAALTLYCPKCRQAVQWDWSACPYCGIIFSANARPAYRSPSVWHGIRNASVSKPVLYRGAAASNILGFSIVCLLIVVALYLLLGLNQTHRTARILPAKTDVLITISPTIWQLPALLYYQNLQKAGAVFATVPGASRLVEISADIPKSEIDLQRDVLPWIGNEVSLAQLSNADLNAYPEQRPASYYGPPLLLTAATRSISRSGALLAKIRVQWEAQGIQFKESSYRGVAVTEVSSPDRIPLAFATYRGLVMVGSDARVIAAAIDTGEGDRQRSLYAQQNYQETLKQLPNNRLGVIFFNWARIKEGRTYGLTDYIMMGMNYPSAVENLGLAFGLNPDGLQFDLILAYDTAALTDAQIKQLRQPDTTQALARALPNQTILYLTGRDLALSWRAMLDGIAQEPSVPANRQEWNNMMDETRRQTGVDLEEDLLAYLSGEYAVALVNDSSGMWGDPTIPYGVLAVFELSNPSQVARSIENVARFLVQDSNGSLQLVVERVGQNEVWFLQDMDTGEKRIGYTIANSLLWLGSSNLVMQLLETTGEENLADNPEFHEVIDALPAGSRFSLCIIDLQRMLELYIGNQEEFNREVLPYVRDLQAIRLSLGRMNSQGVLHGVIQVFTQ